jgi:hypothetical protein
MTERRPGGSEGPERTCDLGGRRSLVLRGLGPGSTVMARVLPTDGRACEEGRRKSAGRALETVTWEARLTRE